MDLDDLLDGGHRRRHGMRRAHGHDDDHGGGDHHDHRRDHDHDDRESWPVPGGHRERHDGSHDRHGGLDLHALRRDLLPKLLANKPLLAALVGAVLVALVLATWLLVTIVGALGQGGLRGVVEPVVEGAKNIWEGSGKPALPR
jgi:hypothetical protein